jgi:MFS family permease
MRRVVGGRSVRHSPRTDCDACHSLAPPGLSCHRRCTTEYCHGHRPDLLPGLGAALSSVGFGAILAFGSLLYVEHAWSPVWLAFSAYALALIVARLAFGHLPDRFGGAKVAAGFVLVEAVGLALMWMATTGGIAALGAALTGFGYSLVFPGFGVEAVRLAPPESRGVAMGACTACLDLALGIAGPGLGLVARWAGYSAVFLVSTFVVLCAAMLSIPLLSQSNRSSLAT